jgi:uncharacterized protein (DUF486 family)
MTFAWYGHLKMREEFSWFAALPLIGVIAFSWAIAFFEYCLQVPANRLGFKDNAVIPLTSTAVIAPSAVSVFIRVPLKWLKVI